jgi:hypothetical protein
MNGTEYVLTFDEESKSYYIVVDGVQESVTFPMSDLDSY